MQKWEYVIETFTISKDEIISTLGERINKLGSEGWELIDVVHIKPDKPDKNVITPLLSSFLKPCIYLYFKRPTNN